MRYIKPLSAITLAALLLSGCAPRSGYTQSEVGQMKTVKQGHVIGTRNLTIGDSGGGALLGGIVGGILGSQVGRAEGKTAATIGGAALGALAGGSLNQDAGQELTIQFDNGETATTVYRVDKNNPYMFRRGDPIKVEILNGQVSRIVPR